MSIVDANIEIIRQLCQRHEVATFFMFGSVLSQHFNTESDIDFVVDFTHINLYNYADNYFMLKQSLEELLHRDIDLLEETAITNPYLRKSIDASKLQIYG